MFAATFTTGELIAVGSVVFAAALIQVVAGFGFGLLSVPMMTLFIPVKDAVVVSTLVGLTISLWQAWHSRVTADRELVRRLSIGAYAGMPVGLLIFLTVDDRVLRVILGFAVLLAVVLLLLRYPSAEVGKGLDYGAGFTSGVLNTSVSTNGPPLVFVLQARRLEPEPFRSTISTVFAISNVASLVLFIAAGKVTAGGLSAAGIAFPCMLVGQVAGFPLRSRLRAEQFRWLVLSLMVVAGLSAIYFALSRP